MHDPYRWLENDPNDARVCYLSQQFVERLCSSEGLAIELRPEIERVVFEATEQDDRMQCNSFDELSSLLLNPAAGSRAELEESVRAIGDLIFREDQLKDQLTGQAEAIKAQSAQIEKFKSEMKGILPKDKEAHAKKLMELEAEFTRSEAKVEGLRLQRKRLGDLLADVRQTTQSREPNRFRDLQTRFAGAGLSAADWEVFRMVFKGDVEHVINEAVKAVEAKITAATEIDPQNPLDSSKVALSTLPLNQLRALRDASKTGVGIDAQKQKKYEELQRTITQMEKTLTKAQQEHEHAKGAPSRRKELQQRRRDEYVEVFKTFAEEEKILGDLYGPLRESLVAAKGTLSKLAFVVKRDVKLKEWVKRGEDLLDLRRDSRFRGHGGLQLHANEYLLQAWSTGAPSDVGEAMDKFRVDFQGDFSKALPEFDTAEERRERIIEVTSWLYSTDHIKVQYGVTYDGTPIERLSPGTRGIVLLLLYLAIDTHDLRPLFIDQPEENLDPRSVFKELVPHFRAAKQRRQVIMVTHNANLVVNTDADQIIVATSERRDDGDLPTIKYQSGSIENPQIRESVCKLLEGGRRAFLDRERRYRIDPADAMQVAQED